LEVNFGAQDPGFELPQNLAFVVEPFGPCAADALSASETPDCLLGLSISAAAKDEVEQREAFVAFSSPENEKNDLLNAGLDEKQATNGENGLNSEDTLAMQRTPLEAAAVIPSPSLCSAEALQPPSAAVTVAQPWSGPQKAWPAPGEQGLASQRLTCLDLARCSLRGSLGLVPLGQLGTTLTTLVLDGNSLDGPLAGPCTDQLIQLSGLELLSLECNQISGPLPAELCQLHRSLRVLRLGGNRLMGPVPAEWVYFETRLEEINLGDNAGVDALRDGWLAERLPLCLVHF
jgi:hypothetical protein